MIRFSAAPSRPKLNGLVKLYAKINHENSEFSVHDIGCGLPHEIYLKVHDSNVLRNMSIKRPNFSSFKSQRRKLQIVIFFQLQMQCHECNFHARGLHFGFLIYRRAVVETEWMGDSCWALVRQSAF